jgi:hypothetical protein
MAFRMAQDLGLQRDPEDNNGTSLVDAESRRRVYRNCYLSDKSPL